MPKRFPTSRLSSARPYTVDELCQILQTSRPTVQRWIDTGLRLVHDGKPRLIRGSDLKSFLTQDRKDRRLTLSPGEFLCQRCKAGRKPLGSLVDCFPGLAGSIRLVALCESCGTQMCAFASMAEIPALRAAFDLTEHVKSGV